MGGYFAREMRLFLEAGDSPSQLRGQGMNEVEFAFHFFVENSGPADFIFPNTDLNTDTNIDTNTDTDTNAKGRHKYRYQYKRQTQIQIPIQKSVKEDEKPGLQSQAHNQQVQQLFPGQFPNKSIFLGRLPKEINLQLENMTWI